MGEITQLSAVELRRRMVAGELTAAAVMAAHLDRIEAVNGAVNAVVSLRPRDGLMAQAEATDVRGGALAGLPVAVKDLANVAGIETTMGSPAFAGIVPSRSDEMVRRMQAAGAIVIGKTNTPEFGLGSHTFNPVFGATRNPWDLGRSAGGSSGGAAAALACGMVPVADGSDMMGSLRNPAGWCGVYGMRPSWGMIPGEPGGDSFLHQLSTSGPMARCPEDLALLLSVQAGPDARVPHGVPCPDLSPLRAQVAGRRIGWLGDWGGAWPMEAGLSGACEAALAVFEGLGCHVEPLPAPFDAGALWEAWITLRSWAVAANLRELYETRPEVLKPEAIWEVERGLAMSAMEVHEASVIRSAWFAKAAEVFGRFDALALPTAQTWPFPVELDWPKEIGGQGMDTYHRWMECVVPVSLIGLPALAVPGPRGAQGLPSGMQLAGPRGSDLALLQLGQAYHEAAPWAGEMPLL
ncbi:amidase [Alphaproteobacteria bacterium KMM 3653]|uniref:Amidase n=1 Tax=Harenicola maris TaxID=2841044 RepID=A0AAP2CMR1_9RHOB|nr:amidase [Harenicola maris]